MLLTSETAYKTAMIVCIKPVPLSGVDYHVEVGEIVEIVQRMHNSALFIGVISNGYTVYLPYASFQLLVKRPAYARKV